MTAVTTSIIQFTELKRYMVRMSTGIKKTVDTMLSIRGFLILGFIDIIKPFYLFPAGRQAVILLYPIIYNILKYKNNMCASPGTHLEKKYYWSIINYLK